MTLTYRIGMLAVVAATICGAATAAPAQAAPVDAWKLVPPLTTSCFANDNFAERLTAATTTIATEIEKQQKINAEAKEKFDNMDMAERAQRMQAFMMKNPQAAMKMLQGEQAAGASVLPTLEKQAETSQRLMAELEKITASFKAALADAAKPAQEKQRALIAAKTQLVGEVQEQSFVTAADHAQYVQLLAEENAAVEKACTPFLAVNGPFQQWLSRWRTEYTEKLMAGDETDVVTMQMQAMDLPGGGYRSTAPLQQVNNYLEKIGEVYGRRPSPATPRIGLSVRRD